MKPERGKTLVRILSSLKVNSLVGVETFEGGEDEWRVMIGPMQIVDVIALGEKLHASGFGCQYGPIEGMPPQANGQPGEGFFITDRLPEMLPEADEVEIISPDDPYREQVIEFTIGGEAPIGWRSAGGYATREPPPYPRRDFDFEREVREAQERQRQAKTGGEGIWTPGAE